MSYQVLARKYRPRSFAEMVGQEHVLRALINGLDNGRLHHAYLFTGTRGVGKTTVARVLARCLNCEAGVSSTPCGTCGSCREIDQGRSVDLIEVDAASRTRVEDTRDLLDNVPYAPSRARFKIYLVDEVHMLSTHSFNALLKTLEEPPPHVKFLFATTDPQKLPVTILSRCLQFNLKRLPAELIAAHLEQVLRAENATAEPRALQRLARAADGSLRDALSLTDQALAFGAGAIRDDDVRAMLGSLDEDGVFQLLEALADGDARAVLGVVDDLAERTPDFAELLAALLSTLHEVSLCQAVPEAIDHGNPQGERVVMMARRLAPEDVQLFYQIGLHGRRDLPLAPTPRIGFEMTLLRMLTFRPAAAAVQTQRPPIRPEQTVAAQEEKNPAAAATDWAATAPRPDQTAEGAARACAKPAATELPPWHVLIERMGLAGLAKAVAMHCSWVGFDQGVVRLRIEPGHQAMLNPGIEQRLQQALSRVLGTEVQLAIECVERDAVGDTPAALAEQRRAERQRRAEEAIAQDPHVRALQELFDAQIVPNSIQPAD